MEIYSVQTQKAELKFSAAHMATFEDGSVERLHGHNYQVAARLTGRLDPAGMVLDVGTLKKWVKELCEELNERVLIPLENPLIQVEKTDYQVNVQVEEKIYSFPREDCRLLPLPNTTMEYLARHLAHRLQERLHSDPSAERMSELKVSVSETPGQSASWILKINPH